jgi:hypothetical protein
MAEIATNRPGIGAHRHRLQAQALERLQIGQKHLIIGIARASFIQIEAIGIFHQEFAAAHHAKAGADFVAKLPLDVIEVQRQFLVRPHMVAENIGHDFFCRRPKQQIALVPIGDAQHFGTIGVIAAAFPPQVRALHGRHQDFQRARAVLFFAHNRLDLLQDFQAQRQPGIDTGGMLLDHTGAQHQLVRHDFGIGWGFFCNGQEIARHAHGDHLLFDALP